MKHCLSAMVLSAVVLLPVSFLFGQESRLSFSDCIDRATMHSYRLKSDDEQIHAARAVQQSTQARYYPHIFAELSHDQLYYSGYNFRQQFATAVLDWSPGDWIAATARAEAKQVEAVQAGRQQSQIELVLRVARLYIGILRNQQVLSLLSERIRILNEHVQVNQALWQAGVRTRFDVLQTQTAINLLQEKKIGVQADMHNLQAALARLMEMQVASMPRLQDFPENVIDIESIPGEQMLAQNPRLRFLQRQSEAQRLRRSQVQAMKWPLLQFRGGYAVDADPTAEGNYWQVGMGLRVPLFRWGEFGFMTEQIEAQARALQWQASTAQRELQIRREQIGQQLDRLRATYRLQQERMQIIQQALQIATANYQAGLITNLEYLNAQKELVVTQVALNESRLAFALHLIESYALANDIDMIKALQRGQP